MSYIKLMRPKHYIKNLLIFMPLIFSGLFFNSALLLKTIIGFICFCFTTSMVYIINDIKDKDNDKLHEVKKNRPIASGKVTIKKAIIELIIILLLTISLLLIFKIDIIAIIILLAYLIINLGYSFGLKNIPLIDIAIIVVGFLLRVLFGATIIDVDISSWLYLTIITISFYLALGKRRNELEKNGNKSRKVLQFYNKNFLDKNMYMCLSMAIVFYALWAADKANTSGNNLYIWTVPLVIIISMRYSMNIEGDSQGDPTDILLNDKLIAFLGFILILSLMVILYL